MTQAAPARTSRGAGVLLAAVLAGLPTVLLAVLPAALGLFGLAAALRHPRAATLVDGHLLGGAAMAVTCGLVAALLLTRLPRHPVGVSFAVMAFSYGAANLPVLDGSLRTALVVVDAFAWVPGVAVPLSVLPVVFPDGPQGRWQRLLLRADIAVVAGLTVAAAFQPRLHVDETTIIANPLAVPGAPVVLAVLAVLVVPLVVASVAVLVMRLARARPEGRRQIAPFVVSGALAVLVVAVAGRLGRAGAAAQDLTLLLVPASALVCVLRYRLYDLEIVVRRAVVWLLLSAGIIGGYVGLVQVAAELLRVHGRPASVLATAVVALAFGPVRTLLGTAVARWLFGDRGDPYAALTRTTTALAGGADPRGALEQAADDLAAGLRCPGVRVLREGVRLAGPADGPPAYVVPLRSAGVEVGRLEVLGRTTAEPFSSAERRLLGDLAAPLSKAVEAVGLSEDLRDSRDALVRTREEERRRIRAELHDDIGPTLAALVLQAQLARRRLPRADPQATCAALDLVQNTALRAVADLRRVVDDLRPEALDEVGLAEAVRGLAETFAGEDLALVLAVDDLPELPAAVEVAAFRVVAEALHNVRRHAHASCVEVGLRLDDGALQVEVRDDGGGPGAAFRSGGQGLPGMRSRVAELEGTLLVEPGDGPADAPGTLVRATLPVVSRLATR